VADQPSGDRPEDSTNGAREGPQQRRSSGSGNDYDSDADQTLADSEQTLSDTDQTSADSDQTSSERDQLAADEDQAASDRDLKAGVDPHAHEVSQDIRERAARQRERSAQQREQTAQARLEAATKRDEIAHSRDLGAVARDHAADVRDLAMAQFDADDQDLAAHALSGESITTRAARHRKLAAEQRGRAAQQRVLAAEDRQCAADDRVRGANERQRALADREMLARQLQVAEIDFLTGTSTRASGLPSLERELDRCRRTDGRLVVAYVDVIGLKTLNDSRGHAAGDKLLQQVVALIKKQLRSYDLIIRMGGDEFLCVVSTISLSDARSRFSAINEALADASGPGAIRSGLAELLPDETAEDLIARADGELVERRRANGDGRPRVAVDDAGTQRQSGG
jgi:diguanylate cyclase (GGDEF)-like protein